MTPEDDPVAQRHELLGTKKIYQELTEKALPPGGMEMKIMRPSPNIREVQIQRENQLDNWHALKQLEIALKGISTESKKYHRVKWHYELEEKLHAVRTHAYHSLINCAQDPHKLRAILINCYNTTGQSPEPLQTAG